MNSTAPETRAASGNPDSVVDAIARHLLKRLPRETSGADTAAAYDFQKNWALCLLLELHRTNADYALILEFHEDLVVLGGPATSPTRVHFYQVKKRETGNWTCKSLCSAKPGKLSVLSKLFWNMIDFPFQSEAALAFVSNAAYRVQTTASPEKTTIVQEIVGSELAPSELVLVNNALKDQLGLDELPNFGEVGSFRASRLPVDQMDKHVRGCLVDFLEDRFPVRKQAVAASYRVLFDTVRQRTNCQNWTNYEDLLKRKAITKSDFDEMLNQMGHTTDWDGVWRRFEAKLQREDYPVMALQALADAWTRAEIARVSTDDAALSAIMAACRAVVGSAKGPVKLSQWLEDSYRAYQIDLESEEFGYSDHFVKAIILMELYSEQQVPPSVAQSKDSPA